MSGMDEGYIKFDMEWEQRPIALPAIWQELNDSRTRLFDKHLIGMYDNGIGFGNVSGRINRQGQFLISGTQTGHKRVLEATDYALVTQFDLEQNKVWCQGPVKASSESMTHAAIYQALPAVNYVFHIHDAILWRKHLHSFPTTAASIPYGTPEMARAIMKTVSEEEGQPVIMAGHEEGIILYGASAGGTISQLKGLA